jgi:hypothetical protein
MVTVRILGQDGGVSRGMDDEIAMGKPVKVFCRAGSFARHFSTSC